MEAEVILGLLSLKTQIQAQARRALVSCMTGAINQKNSGSFKGETSCFESVQATHTVLRITDKTTLPFRAEYIFL